MSTRLLAIDPADCGCTECIIGEYVPLRYATADQIVRLLKGELGNNTFTEFTVEVKWSLPGDFRPTEARVDSVQVTAHRGDDVLTWEIGPYLPMYRSPSFADLFEGR
ncbi:hypothetical protein ACIRPK_23895 [Kitasatospora sp. NPDC101801]|uniref:hypothetical protein n=1 Tax=Kitasatospora sp. NPDC101801 TaxID=3364103 RepID=UPI00381CDC39